MIPGTIYVFGCFNAEGHWLFRADKTEAHHDVPHAVMRACDAVGQDTYRPEPQTEGTEAHLSQPFPPGWSYVTWWDRQGDVRGNSHTGILAQGEWTPGQLIVAAAEKAPWAFRVPLHDTLRLQTTLYRASSPRSA